MLGRASGVGMAVRGQCSINGPNPVHHRGKKHKGLLKYSARSHSFPLTSVSLLQLSLETVVAAVTLPSPNLGKVPWNWPKPWPSSSLSLEHPESLHLRAAEIHAWRRACRALRPGTPSVQETCVHPAQTDCLRLAPGGPRAATSRSPRTDRDRWSTKKPVRQRTRSVTEDGTGSSSDVGTDLLQVDVWAGPFSASDLKGDRTGRAVVQTGRGTGGRARAGAEPPSCKTRKAEAAAGPHRGVRRFPCPAPGRLSPGPPGAPAAAASRAGGRRGEGCAPHPNSGARSHRPLPPPLAASEDLLPFASPSLPS